MTGECWRTGRTVGRTIYRQVGPEPSDDDVLIGVMDTPELAGIVVESVNYCVEHGPPVLNEEPR